MTTHKSHFLKDHLAKEHRISPLSIYLKEIVYGGIDGIVTTFAVVSGFTGAQSSDLAMTIPIITVVIFGLANLFGDGASMALGNFLSVRADQDVYTSEKNKEQHEIMHAPEMEKFETIEILKNKGFSEKDATTLTLIYMKNQDYWTEFMMKDELEMPNPENENPFLTALVTFLSFIIFGLIPLIQYLFINNFQSNLFLVSITFSVCALFTLGFLRWKVTQLNFFRSVSETLFVGLISSSIAFGVGILFR